MAVKSGVRIILSRLLGTLTTSELEVSTVPELARSLTDCYGNGELEMLVVDCIVTGLVSGAKL